MRALYYIITDSKTGEVVDKISDFVKMEEYKAQGYKVAETLETVKPKEKD